MIAGLIQRTRDEGIVKGRRRTGWLSTFRCCPTRGRAITSLRQDAGGFRGIPIGTIIRIDKEEEALFNPRNFLLRSIESSRGSVGHSIFLYSDRRDRLGGPKPNMKALIYFVVIVGLVPIQSILPPHISAVKPDLGFGGSVLIGLIAGELDGLLASARMGDESFSAT